MAGSDNWSTPKLLMGALMREFHFTKEVCAAKDNRALPRVPYMGLDNEQNALVKPWGEVSYCNPPYSMLPEFVMRAAYQGGTRVLLIPAYTDTKYFQEIIYPMAGEVRFLKGRLSFGNPAYAKTTTARFPSCVVVFYLDGGNSEGHAALSCWDYK